MNAPFQGKCEASTDCEDVLGVKGRVFYSGIVGIVDRLILGNLWRMFDIFLRSSTA